jgi:hypothetical protein
LEAFALALTVAGRVSLTSHANCDQSRPTPGESCLKAA